MLDAKQNTKVVRGHFIVKNDRGLHTRPCTEIVKCSTCHKADVRLHYNNSSVNAKSILGIMMLAAPRGAKICIEAEGEDAEQLVSALTQLAESRFFLEY